MTGQRDTSSTSARSRLRAVQQDQAAALAAYLATAARTDKVRAALAAVEDDRRHALGVLALTTSVEVAAELAGVPLAAARDALAVHRRDTAPAERHTGAAGARAGR